MPANGLFTIVVVEISIFMDANIRGKTEGKRTIKGVVKSPQFTKFFNDYYFTFTFRNTHMFF